MLDLVHVRSFAEVASRGTVAAAATAQAFTGPAVSQHLSKLEAELDRRLFDRVGGRLQLSDAGRALLPVAFEMLDLEARARQIAQQPGGRQHIAIAGFASAIASVVVPRLDAIVDLASIEIIEAEDAPAMRDLSLGSVDLVLTQEYDGAPVERNQRFDFTPVVSDELRLVVPEALPASTTIADLGDTPWLLNGSGTRCSEAAMQILDTHRMSPVIAATIADNSTLLDLVAAGHGAAIVPELVLGSRRDGITVSEQHLGVSRRILAVSRTVSRSSLESLLGLLRADTR